MGWAGLGLSWSRAIESLGEPAQIIAWFCAALASVLMGLVCAASLWRLNAHRQAFTADLQHPVRHTFWAALPIGLILLSALWIGLTHQTHLVLQLVWWTGALGECAATYWVITRWMRPADQGGTPLAAITPVVYLSLVGHLLVPWAGVPLGHATWSAVQAGIGVMLWPVALVMLVVRQMQAGPLPAPMTPTWFILIVPPSALTLSLNLWHPPQAIIWAVWGMALMSMMWALTQIKIIVKLPFGMPHWGLSFPLTAFTSASLMQAQSEQGAWLWAPALASLAITSAVILWLSRQTLRGLMRGELLRPEATPPRAPVTPQTAG